MGLIDDLATKDHWKQEPEMNTIDIEMRLIEIEHVTFANITVTEEIIQGLHQRIRRLEEDKKVSCPFVAQDRRIGLETRRNNRMEFVSWIKLSKGRRSTDG